MVGKKSGRALLREEGLQRTDNNMEFTTWPQVNMINQKNYYTDFLKRDDQILALRLQQDERMDRRKRAAVDVDRARALGAAEGVPYGEPDPDLDEDVPMDDTEAENFGSKTIVIHPGSQNLRLGLATDALPKTVPMVIARKSQHTEAEISEPKPKRQKLDPDVSSEEMFGDDFANTYNSMASDFRTARRHAKRRVLPNSRELVTKWNSTTPPEEISEHNDPLRIDWTELPANPAEAPDYIVGAPALRIPEQSNPRYQLHWPVRHGWLNERDYTSRNMLEHDYFLIIEDSIRTQLGLVNRREWNQYSCVFVIPDLYEKVLVAQILRQLIVEFGFHRVCFVQESLAATFGAGFGIACIVDIGAEKTSVACVEDGMVIEDSRINLKYGGYDITETFVKMMLFDRFNYADFNLMRRHDLLLAEELKMQYCMLSDENVSVQQNEFHLRAHGQKTRKYAFKIYDEGFLAPQGYFRPQIFDHTSKLTGRRSLVPESTDLYDGRPNDPLSRAQLTALDYSARHIPSANRLAPKPPPNPQNPTTTPLKPRLPAHLTTTDDASATPASSTAGSPAPDPDNADPLETATPAPQQTSLEPTGPQPDPNTTLPLLPLPAAIHTSISLAAGLDDRRKRDLLGSILPIGGASKTPHLLSYLEGSLRAALPAYPKEILVAPCPKDLDPEMLVWKGGSVFGKLRGTNDSWIGAVEFDRLGGRVLAYKCMWHW